MTFLGNLLNNWNESKTVAICFLPMSLLVLLLDINNSKLSCDRCVHAFDSM